MTVGQKVMQVAPIIRLSILQTAFIRMTVVIRSGQAFPAALPMTSILIISIMHIVLCLIRVSYIGLMSYLIAAIFVQITKVVP